MLAADKDRLVARLKQNALTLRQKELEYYVERYSNITTQASILAGFAFDSLVELDITEAMEQTLTDRGLHWMGARSLAARNSYVSVVFETRGTRSSHDSRWSRARSVRPPCSGLSR